MTYKIATASDEDSSFQVHQPASSSSTTTYSLVWRSSASLQQIAYELFDDGLRVPRVIQLLKPEIEQRHGPALAEDLIETVTDLYRQYADACEAEALLEEFEYHPNFELKAFSPVLGTLFDLRTEAVRLVYAGYRPREVLRRLTDLCDQLGIRTDEQLKPMVKSVYCEYVAHVSTQTLIVSRSVRGSKLSH